MTPSNGRGRTQTFRFEASYPGGAGDISALGFYFGESIADSVHACWITINGGVNNVAVRTNDDKNWQPGIPIGSSGTVSNDKCSVAANQVKVERSGNQIVATVPVVFTDVLKGDVKVSVIAVGPTKHSGWQDRGIWTVE